MHDIVTKETWSSDPDNAPLPSDFNRIESNTRKVEENRQEETSARITADTTLQNNIDAEEDRAIADVDSEQARATSAEGTLQTNINNEASARAAITTALMTTGEIGSYGFFKAAGTVLTGTIVTGANLAYSNASGTIVPNSPSGNWKCMGYALNGSPTLYVRVS